MRNIARLSKPTYLEFDIEGMLTGNLYSEFVLLYRLLHITRFPKQGVDVHECLLERYYQQGIDEGGRVREKLRDGVEETLRILGTVFLSHPKSEQLRRKFEGKGLNAPAYYRQLLHLVYRILFLMVAEERKLIFPIEEAATERQFIYARYYSIARPRERADRYFAGDLNIDLWLGLCQTFRILRDTGTAKKLGLSALNGELFSHLSCPDLEEAICTNDALLKAIRELSTFRDDSGIRRRVNYAGLDVEEFGSVYESLLDFHPQVAFQPPQFDLVAGSERKQTGSYYTPPELVHELIESALVPVIQDRLRTLKTHEEQEAALLSLRVCDPASGSGHFLLAAARRIARELGTVRSNGQEPSPEEYRHALRDVIRTCVYAVDKNPLAVDLCKVALWMEGHSAGLPLSFLDHHIKCGDSLVGVADLKALDEGIPDEAYQPVLGDDKQAATYYKKRNQEEKKRERQLFMGESRSKAKITDSLAGDFEVLGTLEERSPDEVNAKEGLYNSLRRQDSDWWKLKVACDLWTAAFFMPLKQEDALHMEGAPTTDSIRKHIQTNSAHPVLIGQAVSTSEEYRFFHWPLEFPDVFEQGGFDVVLGNPPWERIKLQEKEFFDIRDPEIAGAPNKAVRERLITTLPHRNPALATEYEQAKRRAESQSKFARASGRFPLTGKGDINTYSIFVETGRGALNTRGRLGMVVPTGIATDDTTKDFFGDLVKNKSLSSLYDFENRKEIFKGIQGNMRFCLLTIGITPQEYITIASQLDDPLLLHDESRICELAARQIAQINPNTLTLPLVRTAKDAKIIISIYERLTILINDANKIEDNPWKLRLATLFHMTNDSAFFRSQEQLQAEGRDLRGNIFYLSGDQKYLPLLEAKLVAQFNHRNNTFEGIPTSDRFKIHAGTNPVNNEQLNDPHFHPVPRFWVAEAELESRIGDCKGWLLGFRNAISAVADSRSLVACVMPTAPVGNSMPLIFGDEHQPTILASLYASLNSFILDYVLRQKAGGGNLNFFILKQLPFPTPDTYSGSCRWLAPMSVSAWISERVLELTYTAWDLRPFAQDLGHDGPPFLWDEERRFLLRCELDAAFFHLYGIDRDDVDYIMDTFPIVKRKDEEKYGEYRTKRVILEIFDDMMRAMRTGQPYQTRLGPPPADPRVAHKPG